MTVFNLSVNGVLVGGYEGETLIDAYAEYLRDGGIEIREGQAYMPEGVIDIEALAKREGVGEGF